MKRPQKKKRVHGDSQLAYKIDNTMTYNIIMNHASMLKDITIIIIFVSIQGMVPLVQ